MPPVAPPRSTTALDAAWRRCMQDTAVPSADRDRPCTTTRRSVRAGVVIPPFMPPTLAVTRAAMTSSFLALQVPPLPGGRVQGRYETEFPPAPRDQLLGDALREPESISHFFHRRPTAGFPGGVVDVGDPGQVVRHVFWWASPLALSLRSTGGLEGGRERFQFLCGSANGRSP